MRELFPLLVHQACCSAYHAVRVSGPSMELDLVLLVMLVRGHLPLVPRAHLDASGVMLARGPLFQARLIFLHVFNAMSVLGYHSRELLVLLNVLNAMLVLGQVLGRLLVPRVIEDIGHL